MRKSVLLRWGVPLCLLALFQGGCISKDFKSPFRKNKKFANEIRSEDPNKRWITLLATNDIHGGIEPQTQKTNSLKGNGEEKIGGMAFFSGVVQSIRKGLDEKFGANAGVLLLDAGDQFQGTLISNYNEGDLVFSAMNTVGYDAAVPGNHDYDFGPAGWLDDKVTPETDQNPRGVIEHLSHQAAFPLLSANVYLKSSIQDFKGNPIPVSGSRCALSDKASSARPIFWDAALRLPYFSPYVIKEVAGLRVALIGLDHSQTPTLTTPENVSDLCFRDELETYDEIRQSLEGKADLFVLILHDGDTNNDSHLTRMIQKLASKPNQVHAVISGHTHFVMNTHAGDVPIIQSGSGGERFGRIDLIWDTQIGTLEKGHQSIAGIGLYHDKCDEKAASFCSVRKGLVSYEGVTVVPNEKITQEVQKEREKIAPLADRKLGTTSEPLTRNRTEENPLSNLLTDTFRLLTQSDISFLNMGGLRDNIPSGTVTYEDLFRVLPFNNHAMLVGPMPWKKVFAILQKSVQTCGSFGALMQSGLKVEYTRNCGSNHGGIDRQAQVQTVTTLSGQVLYNRESGIDAPPEQTFQVATLDFLMAGGDGFEEFKEVPLVKDWGIFREILATQLMSHPASWSGQIDHRWVEITRNPERSN